MDPILCRGCGADWAAGKFTPGCKRCGGFGLTTPCTICGGACGVVFEKAVMDSNDLGVCHYRGRCAFPTEEWPRLMRETSVRKAQEEAQSKAAEAEKEKTRLERQEQRDSGQQRFREAEAEAVARAAGPEQELLPSPRIRLASPFVRLGNLFRSERRRDLEAAHQSMLDVVREAKLAAERARADYATSGDHDLISQAKSSVRYAVRVEQAFARVAPTSFASVQSLAFAYADLLDRTRPDPAEEPPLPIYNVVVSKIKVLASS